MSKLTTIQKIENHAKRIAGGKAKVQPGQPHRISEAASVGDGVWQGDLGIEVVAGRPIDFVLVERPTDADRQLVPGNTQGAKHCLDSLAGVTIFRPRDWPDVALDGPCLVLTEDRTILHPTHGAVTIPAGFTVQCRYQREWDSEQRRERRNAD